MPLFRRNPRPTMTGHPIAPASPWSTSGHLRDLMLRDLGVEAPVTVDRRLAMNLGVVARCRHALFAVASAVPLRAYTAHGGQIVRVEDQPSSIRHPERHRPRGLTFGWIADALFFYGRAWLVADVRAAESDGGRVHRFNLIPEHAGRFDAAGQLIGLTGGPDFDPRDVYRIDGPHEGLLNFATDTLTVAHRLEQAAAKASYNPVPSIDLSAQKGAPPLSHDEVDALIARWAKARKGENGGVGYSNPGIDVRVLGQPVEQLLIDGRRAADLALVRACGAPAWLADISQSGSTLTYASVGARNREVVDLFAGPYLDAIAGRLSLNDVLPRGQWAAFDTDEYFRIDKQNADDDAAAPILEDHRA